MDHFEKPCSRWFRMVIFTDAKEDAQGIMTSHIALVLSLDRQTLDPIQTQTLKKKQKKNKKHGKFYFVIKFFEI